MMLLFNLAKNTILLRVNPDLTGGSVNQIG